MENLFDEEKENLFEDEDGGEETHDWRKEWKGMPEFVQDKQAPYAMIKVRFATPEALEEFSKLIGQKLTPKTKSIWHPQLVRGIHSAKRYVDES